MRIQSHCTHSYRKVDGDSLDLDSGHYSDRCPGDLEAENARLRAALQRIVDEEAEVECFGECVYCSAKQTARDALTASTPEEVR